VLLVDEELPDGLRHRLWAVTDPSVLEAVAADLHGRSALIADGHHRYATYLQRQHDRHAAGSGSGPWDAGLCLLVDATTFGPQVHPIHRYVPGIPVAELAGRTAPGASVRRLAVDLSAALQELAAAGRSGPAFLLASGDGSELHLVTDPDPEQLAAAVPAGRSAAWAELDVSVLHAYLVTGLWGLPDDVEHVAYEHDVTAPLPLPLGLRVRRSCSTPRLSGPSRRWPGAVSGCPASRPSSRRSHGRGWSCGTTGTPERQSRPRGYEPQPPPAVCLRPAGAPAPDRRHPADGRRPTRRSVRTSTSVRLAAVAPARQNRRRSAPSTATTSPSASVFAVRRTALLHATQSRVSTVASRTPSGGGRLGTGRSTTTRHDTSTSPLGSSRSSGSPETLPTSSTSLRAVVERSALVAVVGRRRGAGGSSAPGSRTAGIGRT
jgi:hypothetical protein